MIIKQSKYSWTYMIDKEDGDQNDVHVHVILSGNAGIQVLLLSQLISPWPHGFLMREGEMWWNVILLLLNQRKPGLTMLFLSAFWIVYPVMAAFPSSFGGVHDRATFSPQTSSIFTSWGGPGRSTGLIHSIIGRSLSLPTYALLQEGISKHPSLPASLPTFLVPFLNFREVECTLAKLIWKLLIFIFLEGGRGKGGFWKEN